MGFDSEYISPPCKEKSHIPGEKSTILPFFGFTYQSDQNSHYKAYGGETTITYEGCGQYRVGQNQKIYLPDHSYYATFNRATSPIRNLEKLEDRFVNSIKSNSEFHKKDVFGSYKFDVFSTPYIPLSVSEYYARNGGSEDLGTERGCTFGCLPFLLFVLSIPILQNFLNIEEMTLGPLFFTAFIISLLLFFIIKHVTEKNQKPYETLSVEEKKAEQEKYFAYMIKKYGKEAGGILQEYAKLKGYDRI